MTVELHDDLLDGLWLDLKLETGRQVPAGELGIAYLDDLHFE